MALCTRALDQFEERSSAARVVAGGSDALEANRLKARKWKLKQVLKAFVSMEAAQPDVSAARLLELMLPEQQRLGVGPQLAAVLRQLEAEAAWALLPETQPS